MSAILVVDDDPHIVRTLEILLHGDGHDVTTVASGEKALDMLTDMIVDTVLIDLQLPGISGIDVLRAIRKSCPQTDSIIITAYGSIESAVEAMREGAFDYLTKPFSPDQVRHRLSQLERMRRLRTEITGLRRRLGELPFRDRFLTEDSATLRVLETARTIARSETTVLITGESGTGKTLLARLIHEASGRGKGAFVTLDCTCFQESLLESELFGHRKGAFTGAVADQPGRAELAHGGTLFLDEVGDIPLHLQGKLMRLVDEGAYERLGDPKTRTLDARIIAATNRDLEGLVREKAFREDLFFRLSAVDLTLPPLRNRPRDIERLSREFLASYGAVHGKNVSDWDDKVGKALLKYSWPGNVRELAHALERAVLLGTGRVIRMEDLPRRLSEAAGPQNGTETAISLAQLEEQHIRGILGMGLPAEESAAILGIDPSTLWRKRRRYGI